MAIAAVQDADEQPTPIWPRVIKLTFPIDFAGERITELTFRRGVLKDIKGVKVSDNVPIEQVMLLASRLCGKPVALVEMLDQDDAGEVMNIALDFFAKCLTTGAKRSRP
jgi:tail assembly chaperone E/41/14-like protein